MKDITSGEKFKLMILSLLVLAVILGAGTFFYNRFSGESISSFVDKKNADKTINILLLGMDIGDPEQKDNDSIKRTDTMMFIKFDADRNKLIVASIPRDILIQVNGQNQKINNLYMLKGEEALKKQVSSMVNQPINYVVKVDYDAFKNIIDAIGGVDVDIDTDMKYDDITQNLHIDLKKGKNVHLDGDKAEQFFRWRKNNDGTGLENGDLGRIDNQHKFMEAVIKKCKSPSIITRIPSILRALPKSIKTDMPIDNIIGYSLNALDLKEEDIRMVTLKGTPIYIKGVSYLRYNKNDNGDIIDILQGVAPVEAADVDRSNLKLEILNGTMVNGLAGSAKEKLGNKGYKTITIGNSSKKYNQSEIRIADSNLKHVIANDLQISNVVIVKESELGGYDAIIILGSNYKK